MNLLEQKSTKCCNQMYSQLFRHTVCQEYINGKESKGFIERKYKLGHGRLVSWLRSLGYIAKGSTVILMSKVQKPSKESLPRDQRIVELEKELEQARLQAEAYRIMIEVAERELQIKIRKK